MPNFIRVNLLIFEEQTPWLYQALAAITPRRRASFMRDRVLLLHSMNDQLAVGNSSGIPPQAVIARPPEKHADNAAVPQPNAGDKMDRAASSVLEMLSDTEDLCGITQ